MKTRRIIIVSLLLVLVAAIGAVLIYVLVAENTAKKICEKYIEIFSKQVLPPEYCLENENLTMDEQTLNNLIDSICGEMKAADIMTNNGFQRFRYFLTLDFRAQADKKYTVSSCEMKIKGWHDFKLLSIDTIQITASVEKQRTVYYTYGGKIEQEHIDDGKIDTMIFTLKLVSGSWKIAIA